MAAFANFAPFEAFKPVREMDVGQVEWRRPVIGRLLTVLFWWEIG